MWGHTLVQQHELGNDGALEPCPVGKAQQLIWKQVQIARTCVTLNLGSGLIISQ